uniref:Carbamoyl phosphate synthase arginine-specific small chain n=1 Tax=Dunaliella tertiolecta TaxID=3047 RepID=A0A7S3QKY4_DUNTE|eukprot:CAMPEP_0202349998 /NCGR_PEP_ID=MMETSP1126-20121109/7251_1 /ASSEMBLY_ACC=CAM_ASM_000457 /TAXON_ID=3047 /ORGANISM="Dunaliella tertiolecta, Strain CCMP1320" /LENGTH=471 /DNA_ID=CAMNT_0048941891 /DNA_START=18 /DNA_END=1433 /DNA_ORIENTATION=-
MQVLSGAGTSIVSSGRLLLKDVPHVAPPSVASCWAGSRSSTTSTSTPVVVSSVPPSAARARVIQRRRARTPIRLVKTQAAGDAPPSPWKKKDSRLVLEDGSVLWGTAFGASGTQLGEVVFNTALSGYQEVMTDPSYKGQFVCFTCPHIGNVGINPEDMESDKVHLAGIVVRDLSVAVSNYRATMSLDEYCKQQGTMGISGIDTRDLTIALRDVGCLVGVMSTDTSKTDEELIGMAKSWSIVGKDLLAEVTCKEPYEWRQGTDAEWEFSAATQAAQGREPFHVVAYDYGIKKNILRRLASFGCRITVVPANWPASEVLKMNPDGVFFSNGPGDPSAAPYAVENAKQILGQKPVFGICMGHQILGQAFGGSTFKLKFGHHGGNHPIRAPGGRIEVSSQNHNFAVDPATLPAGVEVTHINLNDGTCAGMVWEDKKAMTIQYHPEASPGPHDADVSFEQFVNWMNAERSKKAVAA